MTSTPQRDEDHQLAYREAMARVAAAVKVVTTDGVGGRAGITVTAACSVCQDPPRLLVCVNTSASAHPVVTRNRRLALNILSERQVAAAEAFGGKVPQESRFDLVKWHPDGRDQPLLDGACATFSCEITESVTSGTHTIFLCDVLEARVRADARPLIYVDRAMVPVSANPEV